MATVQYLKSAQTLDYTPSAATPGGTVIIIDNIVGVTKEDIAANKRGAIDLEGLFLWPKATGGGSAISDGVDLFWDDANQVVTEDEAAGVNTYVGRSTTAATDDDATIKGYLTPSGTQRVAAFVADSAGADIAGVNADIEAIRDVLVAACLLAAD